MVPTTQYRDKIVAERRGATPSLPVSATRWWIVGLSFAAWLCALWAVRSFKISDAVLASVICIGAFVAVNYCLDVLFLKVHKKESSGLDWKSPHPSMQRTAVKYVGLLVSIGFIGLLYWLFPEYYRDFFGVNKEHPTFYGEYRELLQRMLLWWLVLAIPYFYFVDARQKEPKDGYYAAGMAVTLQFDKVDWKVLWQHCLSWLVKGYFLALMFTYYARDTRIFINYDFSSIKDFRAFYDFGYYFIFLSDVALACTGYLVSFRIFDTHVRRVEPTFMGWMVALVCYQPFWSGASSLYLNYSVDYVWGIWLRDRPILFMIWGSAILILYSIYLWATIMFGTRFSNLTHRGILTNGPYRWTKHPAYISKNLAFWLTFIPFVVSQNVGDSIRRCILLGLLNFIYYLRAKTEEANLSTDPVYVQYSEWMKTHGMFRWLGRFKVDSSS
jgi:protein-S-isoprenylcysteine O-methyltransferase Ste14